MDYLLGLDDNQNFKDYIIDMDDFMEISEDFYALIKIESLCPEGQYRVYSLSPNELKKCIEMNNELPISKLKIHNLNYHYTNMLMEKSKRSIALISILKEKEGYVILVFIQ